jgi:hypothetical protein
MTTQNPTPANGYLANPVFNALVPKEGPKTVNVLLAYSQFTPPTTFNIDFRDLIESGQVYCIQTVYVDNRNNQANDVNIVVEGSAQVISCPAGYQGYFAILAQKVARFQVTCAGSGDVRTQWINVPVPGVVWKPANA